uniref:Uncharacterized protein n=1 Tax=Trichogramma kaykai TaxID=54128 RepID=A0ABD2WCW3_9HYME
MIKKLTARAYLGYDPCSTHKRRSKINYVNSSIARRAGVHFHAHQIDCFLFYTVNFNIYKLSEFISLATSIHHLL